MRCGDFPLLPINFKQGLVMAYSHYIVVARTGDGTHPLIVDNQVFTLEEAMERQNCYIQGAFDEDYAGSSATLAFSNNTDDHAYIMDEKNRLLVWTSVQPIKF